MYLLDTMVLSELRRRDRHPGVVAWLTNVAADDLFLSAVTIGEIERGIGLQRGRDPAFADILEVWLERTVSLYADRILPMDTRIARRWGSLSARLGNSGADLIIAATALEHGLAVVTRNVRHFEPCGVTIVDPFR
ncbi:pilus assembly protein CpaF [Paramagnetospirillum marisnigri]|uniref:Ribonuclease VapC n=1 Tax=Paramagnetospirillum marisnigri TaxID=1285242 RepID=A0A178MCM1_9PROT|nr:type II toxin-antitoxin system VapC family toxin [Paramagnetospirillum marisnigri]OAN46492.1 pilus assembly protein CpaF [Paramagnetospirillum marisnigri]